MMTTKICQDCYYGRTVGITTAAALEGLSPELIMAMNRCDLKEMKRLLKEKK